MRVGFYPAQSTSSWASDRKERVEGRAREAALEWNQAAQVYRTLFGFYPDNIDYGLRLAEAQTSGGEPKAALTTIENLRKFPSPDRDSPRIDLAEARAQGARHSDDRCSVEALAALGRVRRGNTHGRSSGCDKHQWPGLAGRPGW